MRTYLLILVVLAAPSARADDTCLKYAPTVVRLDGTLKRHSFPGPTNYESVAKGDKLEAYWVLHLPRPVCVSGTVGDLVNVSRPQVQAVQIIVGADDWYAKFRHLVDKEVTVTGTLMGAVTGHHHTDVLISAAGLVPAGDGAGARADEPVRSEASTQAPPITPENWLTHPSIVAIRSLAADIDSAIEAGTWNQRAHEECESQSGPFFREERTAIRDAAGQVRKYVAHVGGQDSSFTLTHWYDAKGRLRFAFGTAGAIGDAESGGDSYITYRLYFAESGQLLWQDRKVEGPFRPWMDGFQERMLVRDPGKALATKLVCPGVTSGAKLDSAPRPACESPCGVLESIRISAGGKEIRALTGAALAGAESTIDVSVEDDHDQFDLQVQPGRPATRLKVEQRFETSLSLQDEGPRLDLVDWKHYVSDWTELPLTKTGEYRSLTISRADSRKFPDVTTASVVEEVRRRDPKWLPIAEKARTIHDDPFDIGVSTITFRISALLDGKWTVLHVLHLRRPLGC